MKSSICVFNGLLYLDVMSLPETCLAGLPRIEYTYSTSLRPSATRKSQNAARRPVNFGGAGLCGALARRINSTAEEVVSIGREKTNGVKAGRVVSKPGL